MEAKETQTFHEVPLRFETVGTVWNSGQDLSLTRWRGLCRQLGIDSQAAIEQEFRRITKAYGESQRAYHTAQHIGECLTLLDWAVGHSSLTSQQHLALEMALWYHDVVYQPQAHNNESRSAEQATAFLQAHAVVSTQSVEALIMATCHRENFASGETIETAQWMVDIDLAILGASPQRFWQYHHQIRREYAWLSDIVYKTKREEILAQFLARPIIYRTDLFREQFEAQARENLSAAVCISKFSSP